MEIKRSAFASLAILLLSSNGIKVSSFSGVDYLHLREVLFNVASYL